MQAQIKDNMLYKGIVELSYKVGDRIISKEFHNNGTEQLKRAFAMFMCGGSVAQTAQRYLPTKLDLKYKFSGNWVSTLTRTVPVTNPSYNYDDEESGKQWYVEYNSVIPYSSLKQEIVEGFDYRLYLLCQGTDSEDTSDELAYINVDSQDLATLTAGVSVLVSWKLKLLNDSEIA